jgi:hypothetical protein
MIARMAAAEAMAADPTGADSDGGAAGVASVDPAVAARPADACAARPAGSSRSLSCRYVHRAPAIRHPARPDPGYFRKHECLVCFSDGYCLGQL